MAPEILKLCMGKGFLLDKQTLNILTGIEGKEAEDLVALLGTLNIKERVITKKSLEQHAEKLQTFFKGRNTTTQLQEFLGQFNNKHEFQTTNKQTTGTIKLLHAPAFTQRKIEVKDFVQHFRSRYETLRNILEQKNLDNLTTLRKIGMSQQNHTIIVSIYNKRTTKNKNILLEVEDTTGKTTVIINKNRKELFEKAKDILVDDIIAIKVTGTKEILFADDIIYPEAALEEKKKSEHDAYIAVISDMHAGSTMYLEKNLQRFVKWLNGEEGDKQQKEMAKKVRYLFIVGDNIDGVNHYPGQEQHLTETTSHEQYQKITNTLKLVRKDIQMIMIPGQHDSVWVGEPQPIISEKWAPSLYTIPNLHLVPNPALIEIDGGFKILMYHGGSINRFIDEIPHIRTNYGHRRPTLVVKEFLKRRHLAPIHGMMDYIPCEKDPLVIETVPDIVLTGDQHRIEVDTYNNILLIASSCWQSITPFEEKVGNVPDPCKVPLFNLKTREIKILDFSDEEELNEDKKAAYCETTKDGC